MTMILIGLLVQLLIEQEACYVSGGKEFLRSKNTELVMVMWVSQVFWGEEGRPCVIVNLYSPCRMDDKRRLWSELLDFRGGSDVPCWCVAGDFNSVRSAE